MKLPVRLICTMLAACALLPAAAQYAKQPTRTLTVHIIHRLGARPLQLGNIYVNAAGDTVTITRFKYYLSNFSITTRNLTTVKLPDAYYLVDEEDSASKTITLTIPDLPLGSLNFFIGVDSAHNASGIQSGALDPAKGMYWTWNSGYIMAKLEGTSPSVHAMGNVFTYHIGGYRSPMSTISRGLISLPEKATDLTLVADINSWFRNKTVLRVGETPVCHNPGALAVRIANNYSGMFMYNLYGQ